MKIVLLGSGNVATHLAKALRANGEDILQVYSRDLGHAKKLANDVQALAVSEINEINKNADLYIISVKDDAIESVAVALGNLNGLVVHTSGTTNISVLSKYNKRVGVFYPLQTFSKDKSVSFNEVPLCLEAKEEADLSILQELAKKLSKSVYEIDGERRKVLHLSAVFASNFPNHLFALAAEILRQHDLDLDLLRPLISETAEKIRTNAPFDVQTGPAVRNDEITINEHLAMLNNLPNLQKIYQSLSESIKLTHK